MDKKTLRYFQEKTHKGNVLSNTLDRIDTAIRKLSDFPFTSVNFCIGEGNGCINIDFHGNRADFKQFLEKWKQEVDEQFQNL